MIGVVESANRNFRSHITSVVAEVARTSHRFRSKAFASGGAKRNSPLLEGVDSPQVCATSRWSGLKLIQSPC